jgi:hypothetical protein
MENFPPHITTYKSTRRHNPEEQHWEPKLCIACLFTSVNHQYHVQYNEVWTGEVARLLVGFQEQTLLPL